MNLLPHLPDEVVRRGPNLSVYKAWFLLIRGQLQSAAALLNAVETWLGGGQATADYRGLLSFVAMQQAYVAEIGGSATRPAIDVSSLRHIPESRGGMRNSAEVILAYVLYREGRFAEAERLLLATIERDQRTGATNGIPIAASRLARMWLAAGRLHDAAALSRRCLSVVEERGKWRFFVAGNLSAVLGDVLREWNRLDEAEACIRTGIADNEPWQIAHAHALGYTALARLLLARGDAAGAGAALAQQAELVQGRTIPPDLASETEAVQVRVWLQSGDMDAVARWAAGRQSDTGSAPDFRAEQDLLTLARARIALKDAPGATSLLLKLQAGAAQGGRQRRLAEILLLAALAWQAQGERGRALQAAEQALTVAEPMGCLRIFLDEQEAASGLVAACREARILSPQVRSFARSMLTSSGSPAGAAAPGGSSAAPPIEPLTGREQEVLALLAAGCSNQDIADKLVITLHAVKKHTGNIYGKLGVASRTQAIVQARKLGLII
jgi:LuxR family maltose regulon positive regulatory protein